MADNFPIIAHDDHYVSNDQLEWIQNHPKFKGLEENTFVCEVLTIPEGLGAIPSALYGPTAGDKPVSEENVVYKIRNGRDDLSRMIDKPQRLAHNICVIGLVGKVAFTLYGTQSDTPALREPWDESLSTEREIEEAQKFWSEHALSLEG
jgi:hypothetical protein